MLLVKTSSNYTLKFYFNSEYGTITETDYTLSVTQNGSKTVYEQATHAFTVSQPVALPTGTQGYIITPTLVAPSTPQPVTVELFKWNGTSRDLIDTTRVKAVDIQTQIESPTVQ